MSQSPRVLMLPGRGDSGEEHWQSIWQQEHPDFLRVRQREWNNPEREEWVDALDAVIQAQARPVILVAHSLAVITVAHWAATYRAPVVGALLVSPTDVERHDYPPGTRNFAPIPLAPLPFPSIVVASDDDPRVTPERAALFSHRWGSLLARPGAFGHLGTAAKLGSWDYGQRLLGQLRQLEAA
ncbi:alpha/beta hydrolase [Pseudoxanthomonas sp.]|uniref:RBBP9/YdeN family alpha/beta hydrolase n=1 Tax=Pseudoxanthomonas sp. TaxID=1871049 RepID=UPI002621928B|nr:alpha/beta hydrolase [Pseudoxanthomonas sp.]WDS36531.1 MAG: alpha/beta hydrolase [Pseudoxanthomonas sp.]